jgi:hypothetical protein
MSLPATSPHLVAFSATASLDQRRVHHGTVDTAAKLHVCKGARGKGQLILLKGITGDIVNAERAEVVFPVIFHSVLERTYGAATNGGLAVTPRRRLRGGRVRGRVIWAVRVPVPANKKQPRESNPCAALVSSSPALSRTCFGDDEAAPVPHLLKTKQTNVCEQAREKLCTNAIAHKTRQFRFVFIHVIC